MSNLERVLIHVPHWDRDHHFVIVRRQPLAQGPVGAATLCLDGMDYELMDLCRELYTARASLPVAARWFKGGVTFL